MADTNWNFLNYEGLEYYDSKSEVRTDEKIAVETERAKTEEEKLSESINNEVDRATNDGYIVNDDGTVVKGDSVV